MKKFLLIVSGLVLAFGLTACKEEEITGPSSVTLTGITAELEITVGDDFNALTGVVAMGDNEVDYSEFIDVDSETCEIDADGTVDTSTAKICVLNFSVLAGGKFAKGTMTLTIKPEEIIVEDAPTVIRWDFEDDTELEGWSIYTANGGSVALSIEDGAMKLVTTSGGARYETRIDYQGLPLEIGYDYKITWSMKSDIDGKKLHYNFGELLPASPWFTPFKTEGIDIFTLGTGYQEYSLTFNMAIDNQNGGPVIEMGNMTDSMDLDATMWIDWMVIEGGSGSDNTGPVISGADDVILEEGVAFDPTAGVTAVDYVDGDVTGDIEITGDTVDVNTPGEYTVVYTVEDASGNETVVNRVITVVGFIVDENNTAVSDAFNTDMVITGDESAAWYTTITWGQPIFTAEFLSGQLIMSSARDGELDYGTDYWNHIVRFTEMNFVNGVQYKVVFDAMTDEVGVSTDNIMFKVEAGDFASETRLLVLDTMTTYEYTFTWEGATTDAASLLFFVGGREHVITVENLVVYRNSAAVIPVDPEWAGYGVDAVEGDGNVTVTYADTLTNWWEHNAQLAVIDFDGTRESIAFTFTGPAGPEYLFKIEGGGNFVETPIVADGNEQTHVLDLSGLTEEQRAGLNLIIFFVKTEGASGTAVINDWVYGEQAPEFIGYGVDAVTVDEVTTVTYADTLVNWWEHNAQLSVLNFNSSAIGIEFTFTGTAGHEYLFKVEGGGNFVETPIVADGNVQTHVLDLSGLTEEQRAGLNLIIFFVKTQGASGTVAINAFEYVLPEPTWTDYGIAPVEGEGNVTFTYADITANFWEKNAQLVVNDFDGTQEAISFTFTGVVGHEYLFKIEGGGNAVETPIIGDGTEQTVVLDLSGLTQEQRDGLNLLVFFVKTAGASGSVVVNDFEYTTVPVS